MIPEPHTAKQENPRAGMVKNEKIKAKQPANRVQMIETEEALLSHASVIEAVPSEQAPKPAFEGQGRMQ